MMNEIMKSDIFFFVTTIAVVLVTIGLLVVCVMVIQTLHDVRRSVHGLQEKSMQILDEYVQIPKGIFSGILSIIGAFIKKGNKKK